jgi:hypothetical protein
MPFLHIGGSAHWTHWMPLCFESSVENLWRVNVWVVQFPNDILVFSAVGPAYDEL